MEKTGRTYDTDRRTGRNEREDSQRSDRQRRESEESEDGDGDRELSAGTVIRFLKPEGQHHLLSENMVHNW